jgi:transporter family-2 protein
MKNSANKKEGLLMRNVILIGGLGAFATGVAIALQSYLSGRAGNIVGPIKTGLWTNFLGGALAGLIILVLLLLGKSTGSPLTKKAIEIILISGALGIIIIIGISFSINLAGVTAGVAAVFLGQMFLSVIADTSGWGGVEPIPLDLRRIIGLILMGLSVFLLLPRK